MAYLEIKNITKKYGSYNALDDMSFSVDEGSIFGLLGPNGAGKTTLIRIITNILVPDQGEVRLNGIKCENFNLKHLIGYMPEERGLYKKMKVGEQLIYLAQLRGMSVKDAEAKIKYWLDRLGASEWYNKKIDDLSKGMSQKIQFISTVMHDPKLLILDEPFSGLDPINAKLIEEEMIQLKKSGAVIIFSTHRLEHVEEFCDSLVLVNKGKKLLDGNVKMIQQQFKKNLYKIETRDALRSDFQNFEIVSSNEQTSIVKLREGSNSNALLMEIMNDGNEILSFKEVLPSINDIFIEQVQGSSQF